MPSALPFVDRVAEFYTLRRASSVQGKLGASRAQIAELSELGRQRTSAAEALFAVGHTVEALRLAIEGLGSLKEAASLYAENTAPTPVRAAVATAPSAEPDDASAAGSEPGPGPAVEAPLELAPSTPTWRNTLAASLLGAARLEATEATVAKLQTLELPRLESDVTPAHAVLFREVMQARTVFLAAISAATLSRAEIGFSRVWRVLVTLALVVGGGYTLLEGSRPVEGTFARASATWADSPDFQAERAIDGNDGTMWILPDGQTGFLEVRFVPARRIDHIRLVNAGNSVAIDRGTNEYGLEVWVDGAVAQSLDGAFSDEPAAHAEYDIGLADVERIRFLVRSNHRLSGGLSELSWE